jgi:hypothetical protein
VQLLTGEIPKCYHAVIFVHLPETGTCHKQLHYKTLKLKRPFWILFIKARKCFTAPETQLPVQSVCQQTNWSGDKSLACTLGTSYILISDIRISVLQGITVCFGVPNVFVPQQWP